MYALLREDDLSLLLRECSFEYSEMEHNVTAEPAVHAGKPRVLAVMVGPPDGSEAAAITLFAKHKRPLLMAIVADPENDADMACLAFTLNGVEHWHASTPHFGSAGNLVMQCDPMTGQPQPKEQVKLQDFTKGLELLLFEEFGLVDRTTFPI